MAESATLDAVETRRVTRRRPVTKLLCTIGVGGASDAASDSSSLIDSAYGVGAADTVRDTRRFTSRPYLSGVVGNSH